MGLLFLGGAMISPEQCRAARAWLGWSQQTLARQARIGRSTLKDFESGKRTPMRNNLEAIRAALANAGIHFNYGTDGTAQGIAVGNCFNNTVDE